MYLQKLHFFTFFILVTSSSLCFSSHQNDPLAISNSRVGLGYDPWSHLPSLRNHGRHQKDYYTSDFFSRLRTKQSQVSFSGTSMKLVNVNDYGAKADGADDTEAFRKAWKVACSTPRSVLVVPKDRTFLIKPIKFSGPCQPDLSFKVYGTIKASDHQSDYAKDPNHWIVFENLENFNIEGGGYMDGSGRKWWENSCKNNPELSCKEAPTAVTFYQCKNLRVADLSIRNAQQMHLLFQKCVNVKAVNLLVTAPGESPNTDGIHVTETQNIFINKCVIKTGDDCISIVSGSRFVQATDITCGPGHGISIGSLGAGDSADYVSDIVINRARLSGTTNGVRIKTWQGGSGYATNIRFQNIVMDDVANPIIIDQYYCDKQKPCPEQASAVQVRNVAYWNIRGTSASEEAIKFDCSKRHPCQGISLQDINLRTPSSDGNSGASCVNVRITQSTDVSPQCN